MTRETRITIEPRDIKAIEFECETCHTKHVYSITKVTPLTYCNVCQKTLIPERGKEIDDIKHLIYLIDRFSVNEKGMYTLRFDISESETQPPRTSGQ
jgi:hypothetical protein